MNKLYTRHSDIERLTLTIDQEQEDFKRVYFEFRSETKTCSVHGNVSFSNYDGQTEVTHSSGTITDETISVFISLVALHKKLVLLSNHELGFTDEGILKDIQIQLNLKNNGWKEYKKAS